MTIFLYSHTLLYDIVYRIGKKVSKFVKKESKIFRQFKKLEYLWVIFEYCYRKNSNKKILS